PLKSPVTIFTPGREAHAAKAADVAYVTLNPDWLVRAATDTPVHPDAPVNTMSERPSPLTSPDSADGTALGAGRATTSARAGPGPAIEAVTTSTTDTAARPRFHARRIWIPPLMLMAAAGRRVASTARRWTHPPTSAFAARSVRRC